MDNALLIIGIMILSGVIVLIYFILKNSNKPEDGSQKLMLDVMENLRKDIQETGGKNRQERQDRLDKINELISVHQKNTTDNLQKQFQQSSRIIQDVTDKLKEFEGTNKQILNFAEQMKSLENILQNPKQRGILGEYFLESLLSNVLAPAQYKMQYSFPNGEIVDAVVFYRDTIIPIDAKFSLEKYNLMVQTNDKEQREKLELEFKRDIKHRIDETAKYIKPDQGTTEFAIMFIPAEGIYYNLLIYEVGTVELNKKDLVEYAFSKHVTIVSPTSFYAFLEIILLGLNAVRMEESVQEILKKVRDLGRHLNSYEEHLQRLGKQISTTVNTYNQASKEFGKIDKDVLKLTDGEEGGQYKNELIDKPLSD